MRGKKLAKRAVFGPKIGGFSGSNFDQKTCMKIGPKKGAKTPPFWGSKSRHFLSLRRTSNFGQKSVNFGPRTRNLRKFRVFDPIFNTNSVQTGGPKPPPLWQKQAPIGVLHFNETFWGSAGTPIFWLNNGFLTENGVENRTPQKGRFSLFFTFWPFWPILKNPLFWGKNYGPSGEAEIGSKIDHFRGQNPTKKQGRKNDKIWTQKVVEIGVQNRSIFDQKNDMIFYPQKCSYQACFWGSKVVIFDPKFAKFSD